MFASALQKRKAVVLSQSQPTQPQRQLTQTQVPRPQLASQPHAPVVAATVRNADIATGPTTSASQQKQRSQLSRVAASAPASQSLSTMLSKRQKTAPPQAAPAPLRAAGFATAREVHNAGEQLLQPRAAAATAASAKPMKGKRQYTKAASTSKSSHSTHSSNEQSDDSAVVIELSTKRRVTARKWRGSVLVDIREFYDDNGVAKPGKKGIALTQEQWHTLQRLASAVDDAIALVEDDAVDPHSLVDVPERIPTDATTDTRSIVFALSTKRRLSIRFFRSAVLIDVREFYDDDSGATKPGKKGISLSKHQWRALCAAQQDVTDAVHRL